MITKWIESTRLEDTALKTDEDALKLLDEWPGYRDLYMLIRRNTDRSVSEAIEYIYTLKLKDKPLPFDLEAEIKKFQARREDYEI